MSTIPDGGFDGENSTATVKINPTRNAVYVSSQGHDSIAMSLASLSTGLWSLLGRKRSEKCPRTFAVDPNGNFLFAGGDHSGPLMSYRIGVSGLLEPLDCYMVGVFPSWVLPVDLK